MSSQQLFLAKMYRYLGETTNNHAAYTDENGVEFLAYPFELFASSPMAKAAVRAFNELAIIA